MAQENTQAKNRNEESPSQLRGWNGDNHPGAFCEGIRSGLLRNSSLLVHSL